MTKILSLCAAGMAAFFSYLIWANGAIVTTKYRIPLKTGDSQSEDLRIVHVSDLQSGHFGKGQCHLLEKVKMAEPDLIVFTGDLPDRNHTDYEACFAAMEGLVKIAPVYYINGNHELALPQDEIGQMYRKLEALGVEMLFDRGVFVRKKGKKFLLAGVSEETLYTAKTGAKPGGRDRDLGRGKISDTDIDPAIIRRSMEISLNMAEEELPGQKGYAREIQKHRKDGTDEEEKRESLKILLVHEPQFLETYAEEKFDLIFAGHAHGGQVRLPFTQGLFAPGQGILPKLTSGVHEMNHTLMIISRGLGNSTFPLRVFNRPEIVVVEICGVKKTKKEIIDNLCKK